MNSFWYKVKTERSDYSTADSFSYLFTVCEKIFQSNSGVGKCSSEKPQIRERQTGWEFDHSAWRRQGSSHLCYGAWQGQPEAETGRQLAWSALCSSFDGKEHRQVSTSPFLYHLLLFLLKITCCKFKFLDCQCLLYSFLTISKL